MMETIDLEDVKEPKEPKEESQKEGEKKGGTDEASDGDADDAPVLGECRPAAVARVDRRVDLQHQQAAWIEGVRRAHTVVLAVDA